MQFALVSFVFTWLVVAMVAIEGWSGWSRGFAIVWLSVLTVAAVSALGGLAVAAFGRLPWRRRALIAALCLPAPLAVAFVTWVIYWLFHHSLN